MGCPQGCIDHLMVDALRWHVAVGGSLSWTYPPACSKCHASPFALLCPTQVPFFPALLTECLHICTMHMPTHPPTRPCIPSPPPTRAPLHSMRPRWRTPSCAALWAAAWSCASATSCCWRRPCLTRRATSSGLGATLIWLLLLLLCLAAPGSTVLYFGNAAATICLTLAWSQEGLCACLTWWCHCTHVARTPRCL